MMQRKVRSAALWLAGLVVSRGLTERRQRRRNLTGRLCGAAAALLLAAGLSAARRWPRRLAIRLP